MPRRSEARPKMIDAARELIRERGYNATAFSDVLKASGAPRGSVYFHFPDGKTQLGIEAAQAHAHEQVALIDHAAEQAASAAGLIEIYLDLGRESMVASDYARGCAIAPLVIEGATQESAEVQETVRRSFSQMIDRLEFHFVAFGVEPTAARTLAHAVITGIEGAMVMARSLRSPAPYDSMRAVLISHAATVSPKSPTRKRR
jgi:TetR/AcrR family transcriptional regulator, lmrAB and yxaGH operons repressor